ncbi:hypothetical protein LTR62_000701 [Meristemomyces frigidus]|uniref:Diaminohydroxyphosphoribosylamino-pyrimidine deaminase n=1 Tax=Meristemomyces frigidus TaxID=1508187 RepID=A0AAN7T907_9PEZI|nr:hypothetical protein LTR62_000701 [Meristemomyces frigidus]
MTAKDFLAALGEEIVDVDEESFDLFLQNPALPDLGMLDANAKTLELTVGGRDYTIVQSPGLLQSKNEHGTTGAAVWQSSVRVAKWLAGPPTPVTDAGLFGGHSTVLELGSGISGLVANTLAPKVTSFVATDQQQVLKLLRANIDANNVASTAKHSRQRASKEQVKSSNVRVLPLDWEEDDIPKQLTSNGLADGVDVVIACDCIYNYALVEPFVQACEDIARLRKTGSEGSKPQQGATVSLVVQQLRQSEVFELWLRAFMRSFRVWRLPDRMLDDQLRNGSGFAVHAGILR